MKSIVNTTANTANTIVINNMSAEDKKLFAMCNMLFKGRGFCVVQKPDYRGGHYNEIEPYDYETKDFEYYSWYGTPMEYVQQKPSFTTHIEPLHEQPRDYEYSAVEMIEWEIKHRMK
jgi:hypothetical protein